MPGYIQKGRFQFMAKPSSSGPWSPTSDAGLIAWYDFADSGTITVTGSGISQITNKKSGGTYTLTQTNDTYRPSWDGSIARGRGGASANSGLRYIGSIPWTNAAYQIHATFYMSAQDAVNDYYPWAVADVTQSNFYHYSNIGQSTYFIRYRTNSTSGTTGQWNSEFGGIETGLKIRTLSFDGLASGESQTWTDAVAQNGLTGANVNPVTGGFFALLYNASTPVYLGDVCITSSVDGATRALYESYLTTKRGL